MDKVKIKINKLTRRHKRVRAKIKGTKETPRLSVFRSNKHIFLQLIDDDSGKTLASVSDLKIKKSVGKEIKKTKTKTELAKEMGKDLAEIALKNKIKKVVFDRGGYKYHGKVKAVAEGAREKGFEF